MVYETVRCSTTTTHGTKKDDNDNDNDDDTATNQDQLQRFANLIDFYSLDGMQGMKFSAWEYHPTSDKDGDGRAGEERDREKGDIDFFFVGFKKKVLIT